MKRSEIKRQFNKTLKASIKSYQYSHELDIMIRMYYGDNHYSRYDKDEIIGALDYGHGGLTFERFDEVMKELNKK